MRSCWRVIALLVSLTIISSEGVGLVGAEPPTFDTPPAGAGDPVLPMDTPPVLDAVPEGPGGVLDGTGDTGQPGVVVVKEGVVEGGAVIEGGVVFEGAEPFVAERADRRHLTLADAMRMAVESNLLIQAGRFGSPVAHEAWIQADASFDKLLTAGLSVTRAEQPTSSAFFGNSIRNTNVRGSVGVSQRLRDGSTASLIYEADRLDTTQLFTEINPSWTQAVTAEIRHPLLRGRGRVVQTDLRKAANNMAAAQANFEVQVESVLVAVAESYWELAYSQHNLETLRKSETVAQTLLEDVQSRVRAGVATPLETSEARAGVERRRSDRIAAEGVRLDASDRLLSLIQPFRVTEISNIELVAVDDVMRADVRVANASERTFVQRAVRGRSELRVLRAEIANRGLDQVSAHDSIKPQLDLVGRVSSTGLRRRIGDSFLDVAKGDSPTASLGVEFSVFLGQRAAKSRWRAAGWLRRQANLRLREQENQIVLAVRRALRDMRTARAVAEASRAEVSAAQETLDGELLRLREGKSTPFRTLELEDDLSRARTRTARAATNARRAEARLLRAVGGLTTRHGGRVPQFPHCSKRRRYGGKR